jgi:hypothetical protein
MLLFTEKADPFEKSVAQSTKTGSINYSPSKSDKAKASSAYKNSSADVQKKLAMMKKAGQSKPKSPAKPKLPTPAKPKPVSTKPKSAIPAKPKPAAPVKPKTNEEWEFGQMQPLPGCANSAVWTPHAVVGGVLKQQEKRMYRLTEWNSKKILMVLRKVLVLLQKKTGEKYTIISISDTYRNVFSRRVSPLRDGNALDEKGKPWASTMCFAWFVWDKRYSGEPVLKWI